ncbi:MAG: type II secretion system protein GspG [Arenimonas sp.]
MKHQYRALPKQSGFTLIELAVVIVLIGTIMAVAVSSITNNRKQANARLAVTQLNLLAQKVSEYESDVGSLPDSLDALVKEPSNAEGWLGPYVDVKQLKDPFGGMIEYRVPGTDAEFELVCLGADKKAGGDGFDKDIVIKP